MTISGYFILGCLYNPSLNHTTTLRIQNNSDFKVKKKRNQKRNKYNKKFNKGVLWLKDHNFKMACKWDFTEFFSVPVFTVCQIDISQKSNGKRKEKPPTGTLKKT